MKLLPAEELLLSSNENKIMLTDHRLCMKDGNSESSYSISMFLEDISSMEVKYRSRPFLWIMALLCGIGGVYLLSERSSGDFGYAVLAFAVAFLIAWWLSRKHVVAISSNGGAPLIFEIQGNSSEKINDFIYRVALAKQVRVNRLARIPEA